MKQGIIYEDSEVRQLAKGAIVTALAHRWLAQHTNLDDFHDQAEQLLEAIPTDILRYFCSNTIRSFTYGSKPLDILTQVEEFRLSTQSTIKEEE